MFQLCTFVLKILTLMLTDSCCEFCVFFNCRHAALALLILALTYASDPPCLSMMLPRYVNISTCSRASPSCVIGLIFSVLYLRIFLFHLCKLRPTECVNRNMTSHVTTSLNWNIFSLLLLHLSRNFAGRSKSHNTVMTFLMLP